MMMINIKNLFAVLLLTILVGCFGSSPSSAANSFMSALQDGNATKAKQYATTNSAVVLDMMVAMGKLPNVKSFKIVKELVDGNRAMVRYTQDDSGQEQELNLVKVDGEWKVQISK
jgi:hypothetical protein